MRSSTISNSSITSGQTSSHEKSSKQYDGFETAESDFVYESTCSTETKKYEMGKHVEKHEVPLTVHELSKSISVPICVEDWVASHSDKASVGNYAETSSNKQVTQKADVSENSSMCKTSSSVKSMSTEMKQNVHSIPIQVISEPPQIQPKILKSLPPLPRSQSASMFQEKTSERINEHSRNIYRKFSLKKSIDRQYE